MWSSVVYEEDKTSPCSRSKHSVTLLGNFLYLLAGRNGNVPLKDFWRFDLINKKWELMKPSGDSPPSLQEHTAVAYRDNIYVFGGELGFSSGQETPLWIYESKKNHWKKMKGQNGASVPKGRRGHTTLLHCGAAMMYGGYCDLKGSSNELWIFHFETGSWHLWNTGKTDPSGRHKHSAILYNDCMWVYGGMTDLQEKSDFWRFDTEAKKWFLIKCKVNPGPLHSHIACTLHSSMIIFGGERNGHLVNELWRFNFGAETWQRIELDVICPQPISESCAITIPEQLFHENNVQNENSPPVVLRRQCSSPTSMTRDRCSPIRTRKAAQMDIFPSSIFNEFSYLPSAQGAMLPPRRQATTPNSCNLSFLKEISKLSQINLSRLAPHGRCSYHVLDSNESLHNVEETTQFEGEYISQTKVFTPSSSNYMLRQVSSMVNTPLTPSDAAKLVYLEDEEAPDFSTEDISYITQKLHPSQNRRSYPLTNSVKFADPLVTPDEGASPEITSDYASCENIHKLISSNNKLNSGGRTPNKDAVVSFSNPNYLSNTQQHMEYVEQKISRGDYVKLNGPADSLLEEKVRHAYEMNELRPKPPKTLPLANGHDNMQLIGCEGRKKYRACSATLSKAQQQRSTLCVFLVGGKNHAVSLFRKPISIWKLALTKDIY